LDTPLYFIVPELYVGMPSEVCFWY
jgi:hypothetical protein